MVGIYVFIAICLLVPCAIAGYYIYVSVQNKKAKRKLETRKVTADLFYRSKNLQYMAKVFKKKDSDAYILKTQIAIFAVGGEVTALGENPNSFYIGGLRLTVKDRSGNVVGSYYYDNTIMYDENEVQEGTTGIKDIKKERCIDFDIDLAPGAVNPDGSCDLLLDSEGSATKAYWSYDEKVTGIPCKREASAK